MAPELPAEMTQLPSFRWDRGVWSSIGNPTFHRPERMEQVGTVEGSPVYQARGTAASYSAFAAMAPCVYRIYRNWQLYHPM